MDKKDYVSFEVAQELRKKEYNEACHAFYHNRRDKSFFQAKDSQRFSTCEYPYHNENEYLDSAPTLWEAQKWLSNERNIFVNAFPVYDSHYEVIDYRVKIYNYVDMYAGDNGHLLKDIWFEKYEEALNAGILEALKLI